MEGDGNENDAERYEEDESVSDILRDRFRLSTISIAESEGKLIRYETSNSVAFSVRFTAFFLFSFLIFLLSS